MWLALSTSSPFTSVAVFDGERLVAADAKQAPMRASGALVEMARRLCGLSGIELFVCDVGPGSFTGTRVGVTFAKTLAYSFGRQVAGVSSFSLVAEHGIVAVPARRGAYLLREEDGTVSQVSESDMRLETVAGYGERFSEQRYPDAKNARTLFSSLVPVSPELLVPDYVFEPSISTPKTPYR